MDSSTETIMLLLLSLSCVAALIMVPIKEGEDSLGVRANMGVRGSHRRGGARQVSKQIVSESWLTHSRENPEELSQQF